MQEERKTSFVAPVTIMLAIDGADVSVSPMTVEQLTDMLEVSDPLFEELVMLDGELLDRLAADLLTTADSIYLLRLLARKGKSLLDVIALATRCHQVTAAEGHSRVVAGVEHRQWVGKLLPDRAVELLQVCVQVNADFFSQAFPDLKTLLERFAPRQPEDSGNASSPGQTPSPS